MNHSDQESIVDSIEESPLMDTDLMGEKILNKKAVYEPSTSQRCRQLVCSRAWAVAVLVTMGLFLVLIAIIAAFARPGSYLCQSLTGGSSDSEQEGPASESPSGQDKILLSTDGRHFPWKDIRLPRSVLPDYYEIFMHPNISESVFSGQVTIHCSVVSSTDFIVFHVKELNVSRVQVLRGDVEVALHDQMEYTGNEQYYVKLEQALAADSKINIVVHFRGKLNNKLNGFYKSSYQTAAGETRMVSQHTGKPFALHHFSQALYRRVIPDQCLKANAHSLRTSKVLKCIEMATTHFEPTDARAAFPCFDEPDLKANFTLSIVRDTQHITLFNMPLKESRPYGESLVRDDYTTSVKMSTYLVAFVVCDFKNVSSHTKQGTLVRVFAPEDQIHLADYALSVAVKVLDYYNEFFGLPYPLPKQDMIAIPDFEAGAMENWGLITYRMTAILLDPQKTSASSKQWVTIVIAHELAHQWFGNIVTMSWWDDLWLNEGFASFVEYIGAGIAEPTFGMEDQFVYATLHRALYLDSFANSHPIQVEVADPAQINAIFDEISYDKGSSLIAMLRGFIGEEAFKAGLHNYLTTHAYGNARTDDLWQSLQEASNMDKSLTVKDVMDTWTKQMGYPVVTVKRKQGSNQLMVSQKRFLLSNAESQSHQKGGNASDSGSKFNYVWKVPLTYTTKLDQKKKLVWLTDKEMTLPVTLEDMDWFKANLETRGYYRVNYEPELWKRIIQQLKEDMNVFSVRDRAGLLDDAFSLARAGLLDYDIVFELLGYLRQETHYVPLRTAFGGYSFVGGRMYLTDVYPTFQSYMLSLVTPLLRSMGWKQQDQHLDKLLQGSLLSFAISLDDQTSIDQAKQHFKGNWSSIPDSLRPLVYNMGVKYGDDDTWHNIYNNFTTSNIPAEKKQFLSALTYTTDPRRIQLFLKDALNEKVIRSQDSQLVISNIADKESGHIFAWRFMQQQWETLYKRYGVASFTLPGLVKSVISPFNTQFDYDEVSAFFKDRKMGSATLALKQSLETVKTHIDWTAQNEAKIIQWFKVYANGTQ